MYSTDDIMYSTNDICILLNTTHVKRETFFSNEEFSKRKEVTSNSQFSRVFILKLAQLEDNKLYKKAHARTQTHTQFIYPLTNSAFVFKFIFI
jgi:hypothetical protein